MRWLNVVILDARSAQSGPICNCCEMARVLHVAEKASLAATIAAALSHGSASERSGACGPVHEWTAPFRQMKQARHRATAVRGHVYELDFRTDSQSWVGDPESLFDAGAFMRCFLAHAQQSVQQHIMRASAAVALHAASSFGLLQSHALPSQCACKELHK
eukprot:6214820-Pleurochrysis_carterae.AAC.5